FRRWRIGLRGMRGLGTRAPPRHSCTPAPEPRREQDQPTAARSILQFAPQVGAVASMPLREGFLSESHSYRQSHWAEGTRILRPSGVRLPLHGSSGGAEWPDAPRGGLSGWRGG